ncbi:hypothetical protein B0H11DRAFT_1915822 [Mycena galericulata]|nr:hypothetical protein B0H11DRAFT_1915822 [Mycena galericulata]
MVGKPKPDLTPAGAAVSAEYRRLESFGIVLPCHLSPHQVWIIKPGVVIPGFILAFLEDRTRFANGYKWSFGSYLPKYCIGVVYVFRTARDAPYHQGQKEHSEEYKARAFSASHKTFGVVPAFFAPLKISLLRGPNSENGAPPKCEGTYLERIILESLETHENPIVVQPGLLLDVDAVWDNLEAASGVGEGGLERALIRYPIYQLGWGIETVNVLPNQGVISIYMGECLPTGSQSIWDSI